MILNTNYAVHVTAEGLTATANQVKAAALFVGESGEEESGTMPIIDAADHYIGIEPVTRLGMTYIIPEGYHDGNGNVIGESLSSLTPADAAGLDIMAGYYGYVNGKVINGKIYPEKQVVADVQKDGEDIYLITPKGYYTKNTKITIPFSNIMNLISIDPDDIMYGEKVYGTSGTYTGDIEELDPSDILKGYIAYAKGKQIIGTLELQCATNIGYKTGINSVIISWTNPSVGPFGGVIITNKTDGISKEIYRGAGSNKNPDGRSSIEFIGLESNKTYTLEIQSFCNPLEPSESKVIEFTVV